MTRQGSLDLSGGPAPPRAMPVSELVRQAARLLEARFTDVWVEGEIDGFKRHAASGHLYFALKDSAGRIEAMMPRARAQRVRFPLESGLKVRARGRVSLYEPQGRFQFYVEELELSGEGELLRAFEELKARLGREGLFDKERKRPLPPFPRCIGVATSSSGAALHDILRVASRRGRVRLLIAPCQVQGEGAAAQIAQAIERLQLQGEVDVIIVGRGGGSSADLWAFNDEQLARTIARCRVPVISAVGHEVDFTISDFVADVRAPTPSAAAEIAVPLFAQLEDDLAELRGRLLRAGRRTVVTARQQVDSELSRGASVLFRQLAARRRTLATAEQQLTALHPKTRLSRDREALQQLRGRLLRSQRNFMELRRRNFEGLVGKLDAMSPLRVLHRGYAVVRDAQGHVVTDAGAVSAGERVQVRLGRGELGCLIEEARGETSGAEPS